MATKKKTATIPMRWIDGQCTEHTPAETLAWVSNLWTKVIKVRFSEFTKAIANTASEIPKEFFATNGFTCGNRNPLFQFVRPKKYLYIARAIALGPSIKSNSALKTLVSYMGSWEECLKNLEARLVGNKAVPETRRKLERLVEMSGYWRGKSIDIINQAWYDQYKELYFSACESFKSIPWETESDKHSADVIAVQVKKALGKGPKEKKPRKSRISPEQRNRINEIVLTIMNVQDKSKAQGKKLSVDEVIRRMKASPKWRPKLDSLKLKDCSIKKHVVIARSRRQK